MQSLIGKTALVTGASSGIGEATAIELAKHGVNLILAARRIERLENLAKKLTTDYKIQVLPILLNVTQEEEVATQLANLPKQFANIDILTYIPKYLGTRHKKLFLSNFK
jgi:3-hydroxy acid dehydrogenase/malonic semialdehyde reductase